MSDVVDKLTSEQALEIIERLYRKGGEIREAIVTEAMSLLAEFRLDDVADEVYDTLDLVDIEECWDRAGESSDGDTPPDEAAAEIIQEELQPFFDQIDSYHELNMPKQEASYCMGILLGIYRYQHESKSQFRQVAEGTLAECAGNLLEEWRERNPDQTGIDAMHAFIRERCPKWADWLKEE